MRNVARDWSKTFSESLRVSTPAALLSGIPSTVHALVRRRDPLEATLAAGSVLAGEESSKKRLVLAAIPMHLSLSLGWSIVLARFLPRRDPLKEGIAAGLAIALLDLGLVGRSFPRIRALPLAPQVADHIAFGLIVAVLLREEG